MALPPMNVSDETFVREVDEELQRDNLLTFWKRWGLWLAAGMTAIIAAWGGWLYWQSESSKARGLEAEKLLQIVESPEMEPAKLADITKELARSDSVGTRTATSMAEAAIALAKGDRKTAIATWSRIAADQEVSQPWRDLALIRQTAAEFDTLPPQTVIDRLKPLATPGNAWFGSAGEMSAIALARLGKVELAEKMLADIAKDDSAPESIKARAKSLSTSVGVAAAAMPLPKEEKK